MRSISLYSLIERRRRRKLAAVQSVRRRATRLGLGCGAFALLALVAGVLALSLAYTSLVNGLPSLGQLPEMFDPAHGELLQPTRIYDRSGQQLLLSLENPGVPRRYLSMDPNRADHFSPQLVRVTLGALDPTFWTTPGFSLTNLTNPQPVTVAERLVDDLLLWREPRDLRRALRMRVLAAQVVAQYGHVQVLEWYLNSAYYGHLAFGADTAARLYLDKTATNLDLPEAALVFAASQAPALNPLDAPSEALERQREVINLLAQRGMITPEEQLQALTRTLDLARPVGPDATPASAFTRLVRSALSERFGSERLERGGLRVITTLDYSLQLELTCLARTQLTRLTGRADEIRLPDGSACVSARLLPTLPPSTAPLPSGTAVSGVVYDPRSGQVLALLGDTTTAGESTFLTARTPGSLLTPFVALAGFARGFGPASLSWDIPSSLPESLVDRINPDGEFHGPVRLRIALANDYLAAQTQILEQVGAPNVWRLASAFGLTSLAEETSPELLYQGGRISPLEVAQAYGVFAAQGQRAGQSSATGGELRPALVLYVEDLEGSAWFDARQPEQQAVVTPQLSYLIHHVLSDSTARWPSLGYPNPLEIGRPSGAKLGQVESGAEIWAAGYTPQRVVTFWLGLPEESESRLNPRMAAGLWHAMMQHSTRGMPVEDWPQPAGISRVEVCDPSGLLPTQACPSVVSEIFLNGSEPSAPDSLFRVFQINRETGRLATVFTPVALIEEETFLVAPPEARGWAAQANLPIPPEDYDAIQPPEPSAFVSVQTPELFSYVSGQVTVKGSAAGDRFRFYQVLVGQGLNPETWLQIGSDGTAPILNGDLGVWDTQRQEGLYALRVQVVREDQTVETATVQVTVDNTAPLARIPYPINGQAFSLAEDRSITFRAEVSDAIGISRLVWLVDGKQVGESLQAPYAFTWQSAPGEHVLEVQAWDLAGNEGKSEQVRFIVE